MHKASSVTTDEGRLWCTVLVLSRTSPGNWELQQMPNIQPHPRGKREGLTESRLTPAMRTTKSGECMSSRAAR